MEKPVLVIMAAGMSSRYGSLKQIDPVDEEGHIIIDFSVFDAHRAGFDEVIFLIKKNISGAFHAAIGDRVSKYLKVSYAYQELDMLPEGITLPEGREKPLGTTHAVLCAASRRGHKAVRRYKCGRLLWAGRRLSIFMNSSQASMVQTSTLPWAIPWKTPCPKTARSRAAYAR